MTKEEKELLAYFRTPAGEKDWRMSDRAWAKYQQLEEKEKQEKEMK